MQFISRTNTYCFVLLCFVAVAIPITIGLTKTLFVVSEDDSSVVVCFSVLSGRTATRSISMQLRTVQGDATRKHYIDCGVCTCSYVLVVTQVADTVALRVY